MEEYMDDYNEYQRFVMRKNCVCGCEPHCGHGCDICECCPDCECEKCLKEFN